VPLSEHEQNVLREIEKNFYESDPNFAARVKEETVYRHAGRNCKWSSLTFFVGLAFTIFTFSTSFALGAIGFGIMLISSVVFEQNLRRLGKASWHDLTSGRTPGNKSAKSKDLSSKLRRKFGPKDK
jgi:hypothetical protein